jgi:hypothetical protein
VDLAAHRPWPRAGIDSDEAVGWVRESPEPGAILAPGSAGRPSTPAATISPSTAAATISLGVPDGDLVPLVVDGLAPVMATAPPRPGRWRARERELATVVADERTRALAERLGYDPDPATRA